MKPGSLRLLVACLVLAAATLACSINLGGPKIPTSEPIPPTAVPVPLEDTFQTAMPGDSGEFSLTLTEAQLTDYLVQELKKQDKPVLENPRVVLKDGVIEIYGTAKTGLLSGNLRLVVEVTIDQDGNPKMKITSADLGGVPIPGALLNVFSSLLEEGLTSTIGSAATGFKLQEIHIADGLMVIKGEKR